MSNIHPGRHRVEVVAGNGEDAYVVVAREVLLSPEEKAEIDIHLPPHHTVTAQVLRAGEPVVRGQLKITRTVEDSRYQVWADVVNGLVTLSLAFTGEYRVELSEHGAGETSMRLEITDETGEIPFD